MFTFTSNDDSWLWADVDNEGYYFIMGKCFSGSRHLSEAIYDSREASKVFDKYCGLISYFGGGTVDLYYYSITDLNIIKTKKCF